MSRRLQDLPLLLLAALLVLPVGAVLGSWLQWDAQSAQILSSVNVLHFAQRWMVFSARSSATDKRCAPT